jgi:hypothetical protein
MKYINANKIIAADILEPYKNSGESWDMGNTRGWQVSFLVGYREGYPDCILVAKETKEDCIKLIKGLGLNAL